MNTAPDRIYIDRVDTRQLQTGVRNALHAFVQLDSTPVTVKYLRATPEREAAGVMREALEELHKQQLRMVQAGGCDGPLPEGVIESFARTNLEIWRKAEAALAAARGEGGDG